MELVASPKSQVLLCAAGAEVFVKLAGAKTQMLSGAVNAVEIFWILTTLVRRKVSVHPLLLVTASETL